MGGAAARLVGWGCSRGVVGGAAARLGGWGYSQARWMGLQPGKVVLKYQ